MSKEYNELELQKTYIEKVAKLNNTYYEQTGKRKSFAVLTFGCQMNAHDSEKLEGMLVEMGYDKASSEKEADFVIHNTCCVRENAENKVYGNLGILKNLKKSKPDLKVAVCGCMMQQDTVIEKIKTSYRNVNLIFGTFNLHRFPQLLHTSLETNSMIIDVWKEHDEIIEDLPIIREFKHKASVNIMYGCNNFCSYCIVPYVRGRERSRDVCDIIKEINSLVSSGIKEITLLGQNVNSYGIGLENPTTFSGLLREINKIDGIKRIRFMTPHPKDLSDDLIDAIRDCEHICKHIHLPVQSGNTEILKKMNRHYTKNSYLALVGKIKKEIPDVTLTTDIIVGFPGETEEQFLDTLDVIREVKYTTAYTFIYSKRTGTPAAVMDCQIDEDVIKDRFGRLLETLNSGIYELNQSFVGQTMSVLAEDVSKQDEALLTGRTDGNILVHFKSEKSAIGNFVNVKITDCKTFYLIGEVC